MAFNEKDNFRHKDDFMWSSMTSEERKREKEWERERERERERGKLERERGGN